MANTPNLATYKECTGCGACAAACNKGAIIVDYDKNGFLHPTIDTHKCIGCGACERKCHVLQYSKLSFNSARDIKNYTTWTLDDELCKRSASGGFFAQLAKHYLTIEHAHVYGAMMTDHNTCEHICIKSVDELHKLIGTKYIQSNASKVYPQVRQQLKQGDKVVFSGTPCQIAALYTFLGSQQHDNLLTIELICHGTPSKVATDIACKHYGVNHIVAYRHKEKGWCLTKLRRVCYRCIYGIQDTLDDKRQQDNSNNCIAYFISQGKDAFYCMLGFMTCHACSVCKFAKPERLSDFTIGDQWGMARTIPERQMLGASLVLVNTEKGRDVLSKLEGEMFIHEESNSTLDAPNLFHPTFHSLSFSSWIHVINKLPAKIAFTIFALDWRHNPLMLPFSAFRMIRAKSAMKKGQNIVSTIKKQLNW